jgi:hypothetical protein
MHARKPGSLTEADAGCWLDGGLRGHYMPRDVIQFAQECGFIVGGLASFAVEAYGDRWDDDDYPLDELTELSSEAVEWLNSGQETCPVCGGDGTTAGHLCRACSGTGRGPRVAGQNFPPRIPDGYRWDFNDGDFGLYRLDEDGEVLS